MRTIKQHTDFCFHHLPNLLCLFYVNRTIETGRHTVPKTGGPRRTGQHSTMVTNPTALENLWGPTRSLTRALPSCLASGACWCPLSSCDKTCFARNFPSPVNSGHQCPGHIRTDMTSQSPTLPARWNLKARLCGWPRSSSSGLGRR